jgi:hypothetical protein
MRSAGELQPSDVMTPSDSLTALSVRLNGEYREMPGLRLTVRQAARLFGIELHVAATVLDELRSSRVLTLATDGAYSLVREPSRWSGRPMSHDAWNDAATASTEGATQGPLGDASVDRLAALHRHWTWAEEAMARFDRELAKGWDYDDRMTIHPFGAYAHWCALLCAFAEGALGYSLLPAQRLEPIRPDLEASVATLRSCRRLLTVVPASVERHPRIADLIHDETLPRLRRIHRAFGEAIREEQANRDGRERGLRE